MKTNLTASSEMMTNHLQAEVLSASSKFEALQTQDGLSLLFSTGSDGKMYLSQETGASKSSGWTQYDLSSATLKTNKLLSFAAQQSVQDNSVGMGMVAATAQGQKLYLSLGNSAQDLTWAKAPKWTLFEFDDPTTKLTQLEILRITFCETSSNVQYIYVDIVADPTLPVKKVARYYIDPSVKSKGQAWFKHSLSIDLQADKYQSCIGRAAQGYVDGLYSAGHITNASQLIFCPVINALSKTAPPQPIVIQMPVGAIPDALASTRNDDQSTNLYVTSGTGLYVLTSTQLVTNPAPKLILNNPLFQGTGKLYAMNRNGVITLWGKNAAGQVYYTSCPLASIADPTKWSLPVPLLTSISHVSSFVNLADGSNTVFAASKAQGLQRITQASATTAKVWHADNVTLPVPPTAKSISFNSYTTTIQVTDAQNLPLPNAALTLSASRRCAVYINGHYHVLSPTPLPISSSSTGALTIMEATKTLTGTSFTVTSTTDGSAISVNPMHDRFKKLAALNTPALLSKATVAGPGGKPKPLVPAATPAASLQVAVKAMVNLNTVYPKVKPSMMPFATEYGEVAITAMGTGGGLFAAIGDLFQWLESGIEAIVKVVQETATGVWHFVMAIGQEIYMAVIDSVEAVVGAVKWVFNAIGTVIEDIIKFVEFLFDWGDITRTKNVIHNLTKVYFEAQVTNMANVQKLFDTNLAKVESEVANWAGIKDWSGLGIASTQPAAGSSANPVQHQTTGSNHLIHHFQNNAHNITVKGALPNPSLLQSLIDDLFKALEGEATVLYQTIEALGNLSANFSKLTIAEVLKELVGILVNGVLGSIKVLGDALFKIFEVVLASAIQLLDTKIHIPVISDILNALGIADVSFLDLFSWISAVAYTVVDKIITGKAPFPNDQYTTFLSTTTSLAKLEQGFGIKPALEANETALTLPPNVIQQVYTAGHEVSAFLTLISDFISSIEAAEETPDNPFSVPSSIANIVAGVEIGVVNHLVPRLPIKNKIVSDFSLAILGLRLGSKVLFSGKLGKRLTPGSGSIGKIPVSDGRATGSLFDALFCIPDLACSGYHFYELTKVPPSKQQTDAILAEIGDLASYVSRIAYAAAVRTSDPKIKAVEITVMSLANFTYAGLQVAEGAVD